MNKEFDDSSKSPEEKTLDRTASSTNFMTQLKQGFESWDSVKKGMTSASAIELPALELTQDHPPKSKHEPRTRDAHAYHSGQDHTPQSKHEQTPRTRHAHAHHSEHNHRSHSRHEHRHSRRAKEGEKPVTHTEHRQQMTEGTRQRLKEMSARYGIKFITSGEHKYENGKIRAGVPTGDELDALERVLKSNPHINVKGMRVMFVDRNKKGNNVLAAHENDGKQPPRIWMMPSGRNRGTDGWNKLESDISHEMSHEEQHQINNKRDLGHPRSTPEGKRLAREMGWTTDRAKPRLLDKTGGEWTYHEKSETWRSADGKKRLTNEQMRERAKVRPASNYFDSADEMHAEGISRFRTDRAGLAEDSPHLYSVMKDFDQRMLDKKYGKDSNGQSNYIRDENGKIVRNTPEARQRIERMERQWRIYKVA